MLVLSEFAARSDQDMTSCSIIGKPHKTSISPRGRGNELTTWRTITCLRADSRDTGASFPAGGNPNNPNIYLKITDR